MVEVRCEGYGLIGAEQASWRNESEKVNAPLKQPVGALSLENVILKDRQGQFLISDRRRSEVK